MLKRIFSRLFSNDQSPKKQLKSTFIPITTDDAKVAGLMDNVTQEYLHSTLPDPSQYSLTTMLNEVTQIRLIDGGMYNGKALGTEVLLNINNIPSLETLRNSLIIFEDKNTFGHCMCLGDYVMEFYAEQRIIATIGLHHGRSIRWDAWKHDALLRDGMQLLNWLADKGVAAPLERYKEDVQRKEAFNQEMSHWKQVMPDCLRPYWAEMQGISVNIAPLQKALEIAYPNPELRVLELFKWFGSGAGKWSGFPIYESVPEKILLEFPTDLLLSSLNTQMLTAQHLEGAARYFGGWNFSQKKKADLQQIPKELKKQLLEHSLKSLDDDKVHRAKKAFSV